MYASRESTSLYCSQQQCYQLLSCLFGCFSMCLLPLDKYVARMFGIAVCPFQNARNVLVTSSANSPLGVSAKLADLGLSRTIKQSSHRTTHTVGTMSHTAPGEQHSSSTAVRLCPRV